MNHAQYCGSSIYQSSVYQYEIKEHSLEAAEFIEKALRENLFFLYYQEIRPIEDNDEIIREILLRLPEEKTGEILLPRVFLPAAERFHLMGKVDRWVIRRCFQELSGHALANTIYSINLSVHSLNDDTFIEFVESAGREFGIEPSHVCFEVTEAAAIANIQTTAQRIFHLKALGFRFSLDNFSQWIDSFSYLKQLPIDYLKVDGRLISKLLSDRNIFSTLDSINRLSHETGITTVAANVSSSAISEAARQSGFDYVQGFMISEPRPFVLL
ncbi:MAG: EAL domain-containing protein [Cyanobacteria bacterium J06621_11]